jgi:hypothetical protein
MIADQAVPNDAGTTTTDASSNSSPVDTTIADAGAADQSGASSSSSTDASSNSAAPADASSNGAAPADASSNGESADATAGGAGTTAAPASTGGWSGAVSGGFNEAERSVSGVRRIPLDGLKQVNQDPAPYPAATTESAAGRAILIVPANLDTSQPIDVLLHLHGHNIGYRQRIASNLPDAGSVRDVLVDQIEDQLGRSGRAMIAVLPQGTLTSGFAPGSAPFDCDAFLAEALAAAVSAGVWSAAPSIARVVLSGHSGGGNTIGPLSGQSGQPHLPSKIAAMFLFEAINGTNELAGITSYVTQQLNADLQVLGASSSSDYLKTSFRFRGIYNTQDDFYATNYATLNQTIANWFAKNATALGGKGSDVYNALAANYVIVNPNPFVAHDGLLGSGNLLLALGMLS